MLLFVVSYLSFRLLRSKIYSDRAFVSLSLMSGKLQLARLSDTSVLRPNGPYNARDRTRESIFFCCSLPFRYIMCTNGR